MKNSSTKDVVIITLKLLVICTIVAVIVAAVNAITKERINLNELNNTSHALSDIYSEDFNGRAFEVAEDSFVIKEEDGRVIASCKAAVCTLNKDVTALYEISDSNGTPYGYTVSIQPMGFKDLIKMIVAVNPDLTVKGVKIVSMSETSGIGTKAQDPDFLSEFIGLDSENAKNVDIISGATKTSKPVINAVASSVEQVASYIAESAGEANE